MKKAKVLAVLAACTLAMAVALPACSSPASQPGQGTTQEATQETTEAATEPEQTQEEKQEKAADKDEIVKDAVAVLNDLEMLSSCGILKDSETSFSPNETITYVKVSDNSKYNSTEDIIDTLLGLLTEECAVQRYAALLGNDDMPMYIDVEENNEYGVEAGLYVIEGGKGCYIYTADEGIDYSDESENGFTAAVSYDDFGRQGKLTLVFVNDNGVYAIDKMILE